MELDGTIGLDPERREESPKPADLRRVYHAVSDTSGAHNFPVTPRLRCAAIRPREAAKERERWWTILDLNQ